MGTFLLFWGGFTHSDNILLDYRHFFYFKRKTPVGVGGIFPSPVSFHLKKIEPIFALSGSFLIGSHSEEKAGVELTKLLRFQLRTLPGEVKVCLWV